MELSEKEKQVARFLSEDNTAGAVSILYELIVAHAEQKNFTRAEALRDKLMEVDGMALMEIVKSGEIIEKEKAAAIDKKHVNLWSNLYGLLSEEEKHTFYFAAEPIRVPANRLVMEQGKKNVYLYLVDAGTLKMTCNIKGKEILVGRIEKGGYFGDDTFMSIQIHCAVSVKTDSDVQLRRVKRASYIKWSKENIGLYNKVIDFIHKTGSTQDQINALKAQRRVHKRHPLSGIGKFQLYDASGGKMGAAFKGSLMDISVGGMSFVIRMNKRETARMLVGRTIRAALELPLDGEKHPINQKGMIISVSEYTLTDFSIHMKFDEKLGLLSGR